MARPDGEPTEEPTPQRLLKSRQRGEVAVSRDLSAAVGFAVLVAVFAGLAPMGLASLVGMFRHGLAIAPAGGLGNIAVAAGAAFQVFISTLAVPLGAAMAAAVLVGATQTGGMFAWQAARPDFTRLSPATGLKRVFGPEAFVELGKGLVKVTIVLVVAFTSVQSLAGDLPRLAGVRVSSVLAALGLFTERLGIRVALALVALGMLDWLLAVRRHRRSLMMTRDEVKREHKEAEGDPEHRSERQRLHRELSEQRLIEDVRKADFVVINPDHIAVAMKYDRDADAAPQVVAKGERLQAERIKQVAREAGVPIYRDVGLARALNDLPEGEEIPEALYEAVAELLRVLWQIDNAEGPGRREVARAGEADAGGTDASRAGAGERGEGGSAGQPAASPSTWKRV